MYLRHKDMLNIKTIAEEWAKERPGRDAKEDVLSELLQAYWLGGLMVLRPFRGRPVFTREQALHLSVSHGAQDPHPGILIYRSEEEIEGMIVRHGDGSMFSMTTVSRPRRLRSSVPSLIRSF